MVTQSALEQLGTQVVPAAQELAGRFVLHPNPNPASTERRETALRELKFGQNFTDYMAMATWTPEKGWHNTSLQPFGPLQLSPAAAVLHYGQEIFEGMKAYRHDDGSVWTFRPAFNAARFNASAVRLALPELPVELFIGSIVDLVAQDIDWVPSSEGSSLYLRPFMFASEAFLGVRPASEVTYLLIASPVGPYFPDGFNPVSIYVTTDFHRAGPGGTGAAKTGGNYASSLLPQQLASAKGYKQVCYLDSSHGKYLEELGGMNVFVVTADGTVRTPAINGCILEGCTRSSIIRLLQEAGKTVVEGDIELDQLVKDIESGQVTEMFACGTAAVITPIGRLGGDDFEVNLGVGELTTQLYQRLVGIQNGVEADTYQWLYPLL